jgi:2'-5' RNA ligase
MQMYFIAVVLPAALNEMVWQEKQRMKELYGCKVGLKSPAHITIVPPFWMEEDKEEQLKQDMTSISTSVSPFQLMTNNYSAFKPRTIFVAVRDSQELNQLKKTSDNHFRKTDHLIKIENRPFHPHITIATRDLHKKAFAEAWPHYEKKKFIEEFVVKGLSLLKHNGRHWDVVFTSVFTG